MDKVSGGGIRIEQCTHSQERVADAFDHHLCKSILLCSTVVALERQDHRQLRSHKRAFCNSLCNLDKSFNGCEGAAAVAQGFKHQSIHSAGVQSVDRRGLNPAGLLLYNWFDATVPTVDFNLPAAGK